MSLDLPKDFFDSAADAKKAAKDLAKKSKKTVKDQGDEEWEEFQKEITREIQNSTLSRESDIISQESDKRVEQAYEQLQYEKRFLKLLTRSSEISVSKEPKKQSGQSEKVLKKLKFQIEPDSFIESD